MSIVQPYQPPLLEVEQDTLPELQPIFTFLNSHSKKLYTEGYFLKLNDLNPGRFPVSCGGAGRGKRDVPGLMYAQTGNRVMIGAGRSASRSWSGLY